jgi:hypothetical protein
MATSRTKTTKARDEQRRLTDLLTWCRVNGFSVNAVSIGETHLALTDLRPVDTEPSTAPTTSEIARRRTMAKAAEVTDPYEEYGADHPDFDKFRGKADAPDEDDLVTRED